MEKILKSNIIKTKDKCDFAQSRLMDTQYLIITVSCNMGVEWETWKLCLKKCKILFNISPLKSTPMDFSPGPPQWTCSYMFLANNQQHTVTQ